MSATLYIYVAFTCYIVPILMPYIPKVFGEISLIWAVFYILVLACIVQAAMRQSFKLGNVWTAILAFYLFFVFISISWSNYYTYNVYNLERIYARFFAPLVMATIGLNLFTDQRSVKTYIKHLMIASIVLSLLATIQIFFHGSTDDKIIRAGAGTLTNPNALAIFLVLSIPCVLYALDNKIVSKSFSYITLLSVILGIVFTVSRKGYATMAIAFLLYFTLRKQFLRIFLSLIIGAILAITVFSTSFLSERFTAESFQTNLSNKARMVSAGWKMFVDNPLIGLGYNGYYENFSKYVKTFGRDKYDAHNIYITELANRGLLGIIPFISIFLYPLGFSAKVLFSSSDEHQKNMAVISIVSILPFMISGYFAGGLFWGWFTIFILYTHVIFVFASANRNIPT